MFKYSLNDILQPLSPSNLVPRNPKLNTSCRPIGIFFTHKSYIKSSCENKGAKGGDRRKNDGEIFRSFFTPYCDDGSGQPHLGINVKQNLLFLYFVFCIYII